MWQPYRRALGRSIAAGICAATLAVACGGREGSSDGGSSETSDAAGVAGTPSDAFVNAAVGGGCASFPSLVDVLQIGTATGGHPNTVQDGGNDRNATVSIVCSVHAQGNGFDIELSATEQGPEGGSLTIISPPGQGAVTPMTSSGIAATFVSQGDGTFHEQVGASDPMGCTITYEYDPNGSRGGVAGDAPVPVSPPIASGRIWGHIRCPNAVSAAMPNTTCDAEADFLFEQCKQ